MALSQCRGLVLVVVSILRSLNDGFSFEFGNSDCDVNLSERQRMLVFCLFKNVVACAFLERYEPDKEPLICQKVNKV